MANFGAEKMVDLIPGMPIVEVVFPIQNNVDCWQGLWGTLDTSGRIGEFATTERVAGLIHQTVRNTDVNREASRVGFDVKTLKECFLRWSISGITFADVGKAVFVGADDQTLSLTPRVRGYVGQIVHVEGSTAIAVIHVQNVGLSNWYTFSDMADDATITLPDAQAAVVKVLGNGEHGVATVTAAGAVTLLDTGSASSNFATADTDANLCLYDGGTAAVVKNRLGDTYRVHIWYEGAPTA